MKNVLLIVAVVALNGCITTSVRFEGTDAAGITPKETEPTIYWNRNPQRPHRRIGRVYIRGIEDWAHVAAQQEASKAGCDFVRWRGQSPTGEHVFDCGVWIPPRSE